MASRWSARLAHAWNAFSNSDSRPPREPSAISYGISAGAQPHRPRPTFANGRSIISSIYTRIGIDVAGVLVQHCRVDDEGRYLEEIKSGLNECLTVESNLDQAGRAFRQDIAMTLFDRGVVAIVPVDTTLDPRVSGGWDVKSLRVGWVVQWFPRHVRVNLYNDRTGLREDITLPKSSVAIIENPLYSVMNDQNSTLSRLTNKLSLLDQTDDKVASGKLDLIIQLPYAVKSEKRREDADRRVREMDRQLTGSTYGVSYVDATEKIVQLNRPVENQLLAQVESLTKMLYGQLGITEAIMDGTADEKTMLNYWNRTIEPILDAIVEEMRRKFLTKTARSQGQSILFFRDPFKLIPIGGEGGIADIADKLLRNEVASSNEMRGVLGWKPSKEPKADQLINSNMPQADTGLPVANAEEDGVDADLAALNEELDQILKEASGGAP